MKKLALFSISFMLVALFIGYKSLSTHIYNRTDCERFNIDNIELRTGIDIPAVLASSCECESNGKQKIASFIIDETQIDLSDYIAEKNWQPNGVNTYQLSNKTEQSSWMATLNTTTAELSFDLTYLSKR